MALSTTGRAPGPTAGSPGWQDRGVTSPHSLHLPDHTGFLVRRAQQVHLAVWAEEVGPGLTNIQFGVLNVLRSTGGASQRELCDTLALDRSTVAGLVARLEGRGLVERGRSPADRRRNVVRLTQAGTAEHERLLPRATRVDEVLTRHLSHEEGVTLRRLLQRVLNPAD
jgi:DNA-binding MarR family transcriptional regulator